MLQKNNGCYQGIKMIHYRENIYSLDNYERYITDSSLFENTGDGIIYTGIVPYYSC